MRILPTLLAIWGLIVILVLPVLLWISHLNNSKFFTFQEYTIAVLLFLLGVYVLRDSRVSGKEPQ